MAYKATAEILGYVKAAEMELSEAAFTLGEGHLQTSLHCLEVAVLEVEKAAAALDAFRKQFGHEPKSAGE